MFRRSPGACVLAAAMPLTGPTSFYRSDDEAADLEILNNEFWRSLLKHVTADCPVDDVTSILDVGCDQGGLLELLASHYRPDTLLGLEPVPAARQRASFRLKGRAPEVQIRDVDQWPAISTASVDLAVAHEVLHLIADSRSFMSSLARVVRPGGSAFIVLGSHTENPVWGRWKKQFGHSPLELMGDASAAGFHTSIRPLRTDGWVIYDPLNSEFEYATAHEMLNHQFRHKLLFRLIRRPPVT
jgi:SAM-dependent methyltransferase